MKTARIAGAALLALTVAGVAQAQDAQEQKPGFFRQLGKGLADTGKQMVGIKPNAGTKAGNQGTGSIYEPLSGAGKLPNLFKGDNLQQAQLGKLDWPRVALTFTEWGASLPCWTAEARIWTSTTASTMETFRTCFDAPLTETDDLGETAELNTSALWKGRCRLPLIQCQPKLEVCG